MPKCISTRWAADTIIATRSPTMFDIDTKNKINAPSTPREQEDK